MRLLKEKIKSVLSEQLVSCLIVMCRDVFHAKDTHAIRKFIVCQHFGELLSNKV